MLNIPEQDYHDSTGLDQYVTRSMILDYDQSPNGFYLRHVQKNPQAQRSESKSMLLGSVVDMLLNGDAGRIVKQSDIPDTLVTSTGAWRTAAGVQRAVTEYRDDLASRGAFLVPDDVYAKAEFIIEQMNRDWRAKHLLASVEHFQPTLRWNDGLDLQTRPDLLCKQGWVDIKTTGKPLSKFGQSVDDYGYDLQQVMVQEGAARCGIEPKPFVFIVAQTVYPFEVDVIALPKLKVDKANERYRSALTGIQSKRWRDDNRTITEAPIEYWYLSKYETEIDPHTAINR